MFCQLGDIDQGKKTFPTMLNSLSTETNNLKRSI